MKQNWCSKILILIFGSTGYHIKFTIIMQLAGEELEIPDLPANYVMDEFLKAREKANLPKQGTVMEAAGSWYQKHHD